MLKVEINSAAMDKLPRSANMPSVSNGLHLHVSSCPLSCSASAEQLASEIHTARRTRKRVDSSRAAEVPAPEVGVALSMVIRSISD